MVSSTDTTAILVEMQKHIIDIRQPSSVSMMTAAPEATCAAASLRVA